MGIRIMIFMLLFVVVGNRRYFNFLLLKRWLCNNVVNVFEIFVLLGVLR